MGCGKQFQLAHRTDVDSAQLWKEYAHEYATAPILARRYGRSERWIREHLDAYKLPVQNFEPRSMVAIADATKIGISWMLVVRDPARKENVYCKEIPIERTFDYQEAERWLKDHGFVVTALVGDGRVASGRLFSSVPIQMCHFHMEQIVIRRITLFPQLPAGKELLDLIRTLPRTEESSFTDAFNLWCRTWSAFLKEKTIDEKTGRWHWKHKRLRQARDSIREFLPKLFTYQKHPELNIPNTTNSLDGSFKKVKTSIAVHAGLTHQRKLKIILSLLTRTV